MNRYAVEIIFQDEIGNLSASGCDIPRDKSSCQGEFKFIGPLGWNIQNYLIETPDTCQHFQFSVIVIFIFYFGRRIRKDMTDLVPEHNSSSCLLLNQV